MIITIYSWNVNGIRAAERKGFVDWLKTEPGQIVAVQETKAWPEQLSKNLLEPDGYQSFWTQAEKKGYSGVALYSQFEPIQTVHGLGDTELDHDGRTVIAEYETFVVMNHYFPNGGRGPEHIDRKLRFYTKFLDVADSYRKKGKSVIAVGDVNTAFSEIDLARPKENVRNTGFLPQEREALGEFFSRGYIDTFRMLHPEDVKYTWWDQKSKARERNVGWRIDYCFVSEDLKDKVISADIHDDIIGSDHCPISVTIDL